MADIPTRKSPEVSQRYQVRDNTFIQEVKSNPKDRIGLLIQLRREFKSFHSVADLFSSFWRLITSMVKTDFPFMLWAIFHSKSGFVYFHMVRFFNYFQIFWSVVAFDTVNVVYQFIVSKFSAYRFFRYKYGIENVARFSSPVVFRFPYPQISTFASMSTFKIGRLLSFFKFSRWREMFTFLDFTSTMSTHHSSVLTWVGAIFGKTIFYPTRVSRKFAITSFANGLYHKNILT